MNILKGNLVAKDLKIGIVASRFNEFILQNGQIFKGVYKQKK